MQHSMEKDPVYRFVAHKKAEGKHFYSYMVAGCNKFLRIYYARVKAYLNLLEQQERIPFIDGSGRSEVVLQPLDCWHSELAAFVKDAEGTTEGRLSLRNDDSSDT